jgi:transcriptional regulator with XRE-family HTH domain
METTHRAQLAQQLRQVRKASGLSGNQMAAVLGWPQSRVSKLETGTQMATRDDASAWVRAAGADEDTADELRRLLRLAHVEYEDWRETYRKSGAAGTQTHLGRREARATVLCEFWPAMLPGLVQTAAYAREALAVPGGPVAWGTDAAEVERMVAARIERQHVLYEQGKTFRMVLGEAALHTRFGQAATLRAQLDRLVGVAGLDNVDLRVLPIDAQWPAFPLATFKLYDDDLVMLEQPVGEHLITDPDQIKSYQHFFDLMQDAALSPGDTVDLIQQLTRPASS